MRPAANQTLPTTHWGEFAANYDDIMLNDPSMCSLYKAILSEITVPPKSAIDLGTGTGNLLMLLKECYPSCQLIGLDPTQTMLDLLASKTAGDENIKFILGSAHAIDLPNNKLELVISNFALHHLNHAEKLECAKEVFRLLKPGGLFIFGDQFCRKMGTPDNKEWVADMLDLFSSKAAYYLQTAGVERMLLQIKLLPKFLLADGEIPATVEYWQECLITAGLLPLKFISVGPEFLYHRVIVAKKPDY